MQKVIIIGFGFMGGMHAQIYQQLKHAELCGIIDKRVDDTRDSLNRLGIDVPVFPDWESACRELHFDIVDICLPTDLHLEFALKVISAGKSLFCEKPLALNREETHKMLEAARDADISAQVGHCMRFWPEYTALRDFIQRREGGKLLSLTLQRRTAHLTHAKDNWFNDPKRSGGAAFDLHIHDTDYILSILGRPNAVTSRITESANGPDHIFTNYGYGDVIVQAEGGWNYPVKWGFQMAFQAVFENAAIEYDSNHNPTLRLTLNGNEPVTMEIPKSGGGESKLGEGNITDLGGYFNELSQFIDCLENKQPIQGATLDQAAEAVEITLTEIESARTNKTITL